MSQQYDNTNTGLLAKNTRKETDRQPDYSGSINVDGVEYWLSGWIKVGRDGTKLAGQKYFSLALTPKEEQGARQAPRVSHAPAARTQPSARHEQRSSGRQPALAVEDEDVPF